MKICTACGNQKSWRYFFISGEENVFFRNFCSLHEIPVADSVILCYNCRSFVRKVDNFLVKFRSVVSTHQDPKSGDDCSSSDSAIYMSTLSSKLVEEEIPGDTNEIGKSTDTALPTNDTELNEATTSKPGVKRLFCSDHAYCDSQCNLFGEDQGNDVNDESEDDEELERKQDILQAIEKEKPQIKTSAKYDFPSILSNLSITSLPQCNIFTDVIKEMRERCPDLLECFLNVAVKSPSSISVRTVTSIVVAYCTLMFARNNKNSALQRCVTLMAVAGNANDEVELDDINPSNFLLNEAEIMKQKDVKKVLLGRLITDIKEFNWLEKKLPIHIPHRYSEYMSKKQDVFSLPIIFKNESRSEDCLDIMDAYEEQLTDIYNQAYGNTQVLNRNRAVLGGDQLTRERLQNVKNIRYMAPTPERRCDHLDPIVIEHWHVKQDLLSKAYHVLYKEASVNHTGTLFHAKTFLRRNDVNGNVKSNYKAHEDLFILLVKALLHVAAEELKVEQDRDTLIAKLYSIVHGWDMTVRTGGRKLEIDQKSPDMGEGCGTDDMVLNYFVNVIVWGMLIINMNDTAKEGDTERLLLNCKESINLFIGHSRYSKYFGEMVNFVLLTQHLLSPAMALRVLEGAFVNTKGGAGRNKEADLVQEHCIRNKKDLIRTLGANKTEKAVMRACCAADTCIGIGKNIDNLLGLSQLSSQHTKRSSSKDLEKLKHVLKSIKPFTYTKGRMFGSFDFKINKYPNMLVERNELLVQIKKKISRLYVNY